MLNFRDYFQTDNTAPVDFSSRRIPNLLHDVLYLSSYIHDAEFVINQVELKQKRLIIPMNRTRNELYDALGDPIEAIPSVLTIEQVEDITWELTGCLSDANNFIISKIFLGELFWENEGGEGPLELVLTGVWNMKLRIQVEQTWGDHAHGFQLLDLPDNKGRPQ